MSVNTSSSYQQKRTSSSSRTQPRRTPPPGSRFRHRSLSDMTKSPRSETGSKKNDLRARYWKYMFDNFQRAVDSIYQTCEQDESIVECKVRDSFLQHDRLFVFFFFLVNFLIKAVNVNKTLKNKIFIFN